MLAYIHAHANPYANPCQRIHAYWPCLRSSGPRRAHELFRHTHEHRQRGDSGPRRAHEHPSHINKRLRASQRLFGTQMGPRTPLAQHMQSGTRKCIRMHANQKALGTQCGFTSASDLELHRVRERAVLRGAESGITRSFPPRFLPNMF